MYTAFITTADVFGNTVCISLDHSEGELGVYLM